MIYVPGLLWKSRHSIDLALPPANLVDLSLIIRTLIKLMHVAMDHEGELTTHSIPPDANAELSHVLCGPLADPPLSSEVSETCTLRQLLTALRDTKSNNVTNKYSLEQSILLPTVIFCAAYDYIHTRQQGRTDYGHCLSSTQSKHVDHLALSGKAHLPAMQKQFEELGIWDHFSERRTGGTDDASKPLEARNASSGDYTEFNKRDRMLDSARAGLPMGEDTLRI